MRRFLVCNLVKLKRGLQSFFLPPPPQPLPPHRAGFAVGVDAEPDVDGIFRAVPNGLSSQPGGVVANKNGRWVVSLNLSGELYQAFFDTQVRPSQAGRQAGGQTRS